MFLKNFLIEENKYSDLPLEGGIFRTGGYFGRTDDIWPVIFVE